MTASLSDDHPSVTTQRRDNLRVVERRNFGHTTSSCTSRSSRPARSSSTGSRVEFDCLSKVGYRAVRSIPLTHASRKSGHIRRVAAFFARLENDLQLHVRRLQSQPRLYGVYPGFPTLFWGLSVFFVDDLMGKALWKLVEKGAVGAFCASTAPSASTGPVRVGQDGSQGGGPCVMSSWTAASSDCSRPVNNYVHVKTADLYRPNARLTPERQGYQVLTPFGKLGYSRLYLSGFGRNRELYRKISLLTGYEVLGAAAHAQADCSSLRRTCRNTTFRCSPTPVRRRSASAASPPFHPRDFTVLSNYQAIVIPYERQSPADCQRLALRAGGRADGVRAQHGLGKDDLLNALVSLLPAGGPRHLRRGHAGAAATRQLPEFVTGHPNNSRSWSLKTPHLRYRKRDRDVDGLDPATEIAHRDPRLGLLQDGRDLFHRKLFLCHRKIPFPRLDLAADSPLGKDRKKPEPLSLSIEAAASVFGEGNATIEETFLALYEMLL